MQIQATKNSSLIDVECLNVENEPVILNMHPKKRINNVEKKATVKCVCGGGKLPIGR